jgi:hypothetical protein
MIQNFGKMMSLGQWLKKVVLPKIINKEELLWLSGKSEENK